MNDPETILDITKEIIRESLIEWRLKDLDEEKQLFPMLKIIIQGSLKKCEKSKKVKLKNELLAFTKTKYIHSYTKMVKTKLDMEIDSKQLSQRFDKLIQNKKRK